MNAVDEMFGWITDCAWADMSEEFADELTVRQIVSGVERHYVGGVNQFVRDAS